MLIAWFSKTTLHLPRIVKRFIALFVDASFCIFTVWLAFYLRLGEWVMLWGDSTWDPLIAISVSLSVALPIFIAYGLYRAIFRFSGSVALKTILKALCLYSAIFFVIFMLIGVSGVPRTVGIIQPILLLLAVCSSRIFISFWLGGAYRNILARQSERRALIYGAGSSGRQLANALSASSEIRVLGFIDHDLGLSKSSINGLNIYHPNELLGLVKRLRITDVLLAMPSISRVQRQAIFQSTLKAKVRVRTLPSMVDLAQGKIRSGDLHTFDIDDLLGRELVMPDPSLLAKNIMQKVVLVTGAGGSIGSELCRQILALRPTTLLLVEQSEFALYALHQELTLKQGDSDSSSSEVQIIPLLASVIDADRLNEIFQAYKPHSVYHAAAYKHVPLVEHNPTIGILNNVFGTLEIGLAAARHGAEQVVLISTDKAVRPTNVMGASKRVAELVFQALATQFEGTRFSMVRFGNVLGSSGSVVPKFREQIARGGPITLTHPEITRYFMAIPEAAQLVIQAGAMAQSGDVFVLDMGEPVKVMDLAVRMIELSGRSILDENHPDGEIAISISGLRPGEKLYEELLIGNNPQSTDHPLIMKAQEGFLLWELLDRKLVALKHASAKHNTVEVLELLRELVPDYCPSSNIVDWIHLKSQQH